ncbi:hypothetical protein [Streptomyces cavernicola]|uniref:Uncharacterized protein n=1 Tax=Streptomyces cavernicola TaxID=3043613 RepID=A0ABT6S769_9ACTN|nr:hypothetical protein [Streptomyces sp. B-S-A6]MDI3403283.1 hypothetical protein [Streptomyces sp. B-S-A6]
MAEAAVIGLPHPTRRGGLCPATRSSSVHCAACTTVRRRARTEASGVPVRPRTEASGVPVRPPSAGTHRRRNRSTRRSCTSVQATPAPMLS